VDIEHALEEARCALINLNNMVKMMPTLKVHPLLPIVKVQIKGVIESLDGGPLEISNEENNRGSI